jgi:hypothetical protein
MGLVRPPAEGVAGTVLETMRSGRFVVMGFERSYWDFYQGFGLFVSLEFALFAVLAYHVGTMSRRDPAVAIPFAAMLLAGCVGSAILSFAFFFTAPMATAAVAVGCASAALVALKREVRVSRTSPPPLV